MRSAISLQTQLVYLVMVAAGVTIRHRSAKKIPDLIYLAAGLL
jgi:hypothetical protein